MQFFIRPKAFFLSTKQQILLLLFTFLIWVFLASPLAYLGFSLLDGLSQNFKEGLGTELFNMTKNSLFLGVGVIFFTSIIGLIQNLVLFTSPFKTRKYLHLLFLFPLAFPAYVLAFILVGSIGTGSPIETYLYKQWPTLHLFLPGQDSILLAILSLSLVLSPYMYMNIRLAIAGVPKSVLESASLLNSSKTSLFTKIYLPYLTPWWRQASFLIFLECLADFGATSIFNIETLSTGIYKHWFALFSLESAREISAIVIIFILLGISAFRFKQFRNWSNQGVLELNKSFELPRLLRLGSIFSTFVFLVLGGLFPLLQLINWGIHSDFFDLSLGYIQNTFLISVLALGTASFAALFILYLNRFNHSKFSKLITDSIQLGYGIPGTVLAVAVFYPFLTLDNFLEQSFNMKVFSGSIVICIIGTSFRFFKVLFQPMQTYFTKLPYSYEENASLLRLNKWKVFKRLHLPLLWPVYLSSSILFLVDCFKEMPIQLMTRSYGWDTLSIKIYEFTSEGEWERAANLSLMLLLIGLIPIVILARERNNERRS